ncbi:MAG: SDR family NAD(P)-dependent oxidoreductase [Gammaproteobacteria bacterium]|nr:SDR family NAD(P)-dependent oxidoreductase [Gammaproteobacteria bacterium]NKB63561.1 SDR family NAD(P)-dependent oxidoreductase [Gammaproteobacteria bacterium]
MKIFLTGATGFIGLELVHAMKKRGWEVTCLVRNAKGESAQYLKKQGCNLHQGDITQEGGMAEVMKDMDVVIHAAGVYELGGSSAQKQKMHKINIEGTTNVFEAVLQAEVAKVIYISSVIALGASSYCPDDPVVKDENHSPDGRNLTPYGESKARAHEVAVGYRDKGVSVNVVMPNATVGVNDHSNMGYFLRLHLLKRMVPMGFGGDCVIAPVLVDSLAKGICLVAEKAPPQEDYIFSGEPTTFKEIFALFNKHPGGAKVRFWLPRWLMYPIAALLEPLQRAAGIPSVISRDAVDLTRGHLNFSSTKAKQDLGWTHPSREDMWEKIIEKERVLIGRRKGFFNKLRHQSGRAEV